MMKKTGFFAKVISLLLSMVLAFGVIGTAGIVAGAVPYRSVKLDVPRIEQRPNTGDCAIASISSIEAYFYSLPSGNYLSAAYQAVYAANGYSIGANWSTLGYKKVESFSMQTLYDQLITGYPVIVHRTSAHYSVVYGYSGSETKLELSGFLIFDVDDSYNDTNAHKTLDKWAGKYSLDQMVLRCNGLAIPSATLKINGNHPSAYHIAGKTFSVYGTVVSTVKITNVTMAITNTSGSVVQNSVYTVNPGARSFGLSAGNANMQFSKLSVGSYVYTVNAKDAAGATASYNFSFKVVKSESDIPGGKADDPVAEPEIKYVSYEAVVNANPSLIIRSGRGTSYSAVGSIPNGTRVVISAECEGWGRVTYGGKTGWVNLEHIEVYAEGAVYSRTTVQTYLRSSASLLASSVATVPAGTIVKTVETNLDFTKVEFSGKTGWIFTGFLINGIGDIDGDGGLNSADALAVLQYSTGSRKLSSLELQFADMNGDGSINSSDALVILKISVGIFKV